jgi:transposase
MENRVSRLYSESFKRRVVSEIEGGKLSIVEATREYGTTKTAVKRWLQDYGKYRPKQSIVEVVMKDEREKIAELEKALAEAHLKIRLYDKMIELAEKDHKLDLKKSIGPRALESLKAKGVKSE